MSNGPTPSASIYAVAERKNPAEAGLGAKAGRVLFNARKLRARSKPLDDVGLEEFGGRAVRPRFDSVLIVASTLPLL